MKAGLILAVFGLMVVCAAQLDTYAPGGVPLATSLGGFTAKYPGAICSGDEKFRSCTVDGLSIAGVRAFRTDFNFDSDKLTNINVVFQPNPTDEQLSRIEDELTRVHGRPELREMSSSHQLHAMWSDGARRLLLTVRVDRTFVIFEKVQ